MRSPISALRFISLALAADYEYASRTRWFAFAKITLQALARFCLFGRWPKIQATREAAGRMGTRLELKLLTATHVSSFEELRWRLMDTRFGSLPRL
ncbi:MAG: hypothetical protein ACM3KE_02635 [Hyphomicrobiales bacterium]